MWYWIIKALVHISLQIRSVEHKVDRLLKLSQIDFSKEDEIVRGMTKTVEEAIGRIPQTETTNRKET